MENNHLPKMKKPYSYPESTAIELATGGSFLQDISKPGGSVPPLDPDEG